MAGVNRSNVAVTDTFDTWRIRTNEVNTTLNQATDAITANTIIFRDDNSSYTANAATLNTIAVTHGTTTSAVTVTSALNADSAKASIYTTGGIRTGGTSLFESSLQITTDLQVDNNSTLGSSSSDNLTVNATLSSNVIPTTNNTSWLGNSSFQYGQTHFQKQTMVGSGTDASNVLGITSTAATNTAVSIIHNAVSTGKLLSISSTSTNTGARDLVKIHQNADAGAGAVKVLNLTHTSGTGLYIDSNDTSDDAQYSIQVESAQQTTNAVTINAASTSATGEFHSFPALTTGTGMFIQSSSNNLGTAGAVVEISQSSGTMTSANAAVLSVKQAGEGTTGLQIATTHATANTALRIDSDQTTQNVIEIQADDLTSGDMLNANTNAQHTGQMFSLTSYHAGDTARGEALHILYRTANTTAKAVTVANSSADIFTVEQSGDVAVGRDLSIGGNLTVQGTTTQINTTTTLAKDKSIILGAASDVKTGATYTAAAPPVVTSTAHGLDNGDAIFVVASSGTSSGTVAVPSEVLFTVANKTTNTFELNSLAERIVLEDATVTGDAESYLILDSTNGTADAGDNIIMQEEVDATGDSNRTFSWVGPQLDSAVDDAGLIIPGSTAAHTIKWDDTDNYWKVDDSFKIDSSGQLVFPKGTTADRPASTITSGSIAAATTGAMRFNTTNAKFEGITTGTTYENMSTEAFSTAMAIALG